MIPAKPSVVSPSNDTLADSIRRRAFRSRDPRRARKLLALADEAHTIKPVTGEGGK